MTATDNNNDDIIMRSCASVWREGKRERGRKGGRRKGEKEKGRESSGEQYRTVMDVCVVTRVLSGLALQSGSYLLSCHPLRVFVYQLPRALLPRETIDVSPKLRNGIQWLISFKAQPAYLQTKTHSARP